MSHSIRVGIIGANPNGSWGTYAHLPALQALDEFTVTAVATSHQETARQTADQFGVARAFGSPKELVGCDEVDVVSVCVRVPYHFELVEMALNAGKHVYCEWPLARNTAEAQKLQNMAAGKGLINMIGLQARHSPMLNYVRDQINDGRIGRVVSCSLNHSVDWMPALPSSMTYLQDFSTGAHMLSIPGGHSIDALCWMLGEFNELSALVATQIKEIDVVDTGEKFPRTSPDQVLVSGIVGDGVMTSVRIQGASKYGTGMRFEINGERGDLLISMVPGGRGIQMSDLELFETTSQGQLSALSVPESYFLVPVALRSGPPLNVAHGYKALAQAILDGSSVPDFSVAVKRHQTLDAIMHSSAEKTYLRNL